MAAGRPRAVISAHWTRMGKWLQTGSEATRPSVTAHADCEAGNKPTRSVARAWESVKGLASCWWTGPEARDVLAFVYFKGLQ